MISPVKVALAVTLALVGTPAFADTDSLVGRELTAPRPDRPDFQQDDQSAEVLIAPSEAADPKPPVIGPDIVIVDPGSPILD
jgi:hypothetical protein